MAYSCQKRRQDASGMSGLAEAWLGRWIRRRRPGNPSKHRIGRFPHQAAHSFCPCGASPQSSGASLRPLKCSLIRRRASLQCSRSSFRPLKCSYIRARPSPVRARPSPVVPDLRPCVLDLRPCVLDLRPWCSTFARRCLTFARRCSTFARRCLKSMYGSSKSCVMRMVRDPSNTGAFIYAHRWVKERDRAETRPDQLMAAPGNMLALGHYQSSVPPMLGLGSD